MLLVLRHPRTWLLLGWLLVAAVVITGILPGSSMPTTGVNDKVEHMTAYALLSLWFAGIYPRSRYPLIAGSLLLMGVSIEVIQGAMHAGRQADFADMVANCMGIGSGLVLALLWLGGWAQRVEAWVRRS